MPSIHRLGKFEIHSTFHGNYLDVGGVVLCDGSSHEVHLKGDDGQLSLVGVLPTKGLALSLGKGYPDCHLMGEWTTAISGLDMGQHREQISRFIESMESTGQLRAAKAIADAMATPQVSGPVASHPTPDGIDQLPAVDEPTDLED